MPKRYDSPADALDVLIEGNRRFAAGVSIHPHTDAQRILQQSKSIQRPFAAVLACSDARVPVELVFDCGVGDLFVVREAGNVCGTLTAASLEYAVDVLRCQLIVVMGHSGCGAVRAACAPEPCSDTVEALLRPIREIAQSERDPPGEGPIEDRVVRANVLRSIVDLQRGSPGIARASREGRVVLAPAVYDLETGIVAWADR
ncbi:MAG: carbonic anhydrase [Phycisphaerales bacterium]